MKKILIVLTSLILTYSAVAQTEDGRTIVGVLPLAYSDANYHDQATELGNLVTKVFSDNKRIKVLDRGQIDVITKVLNLQKDYMFTDGITVKQNKAYGAEYMIAGSLTKIYVSRDQQSSSTKKDLLKLGKKKISGSGSAFDIEVSFSLQEFDVTTGSLVDQETIDITNSDLGRYPKEDQAAINAVSVNEKDIVAKVQAWVNKIHPPSFTIASIDKRTSKNYPDVISIVGSDVNVKVGDIITVNEIIQTDVEGKKRNRVIEIASLKVIELQGDFTSCSVQSGGDVLEDKWEKSKSKKTKLQLVVKGKGKTMIPSFLQR